MKKLLEAEKLSDQEMSQIRGGADKPKSKPGPYLYVDEDGVVHVIPSS
jgi:hypothetical protein